MELRFSFASARRLSERGECFGVEAGTRPELQLLRMKKTWSGDHVGTRFCIARGGTPQRTLLLVQGIPALHILHHQLSL